MGTKVGIHSFQGGMVKDLDKSLVSKESYLDAHNFRLTTSSGESTGAFENIEGNNNIATTVAPSATLNVGDVYVVVKGTATYRSVNYTLGQYFTAITDGTGFTGTGSLVINANQIAPAGMYVAGHAVLRDWIVLFLTNNTSATPTTGHSMIVKFKVTSSTETVADYSVLYDDTANNTAFRLRFSLANPINAIGTYESETIQKVYWCDNYNNIRYVNIASYLTTDGLVKSGSNYYFPVDLFEFIPESTMTKPELEYLYPGAITAGTVQYAFQYFNNHGSETTISPLSNTIHITTDNDYMASSYYYKGEGDLSKTTGKSVRMTFSVPDSDRYSHIRIIRLHYITVNSVPTITVVGEVPINSSMSTVSYLDNGNTTYGTLTLDEFNLGQTELFSAKDIAMKNNRLFAANINKEEFILGDWDARAVRFLDASNGALLQDSTEADVTVLNDLSNWSAYVEDHDGINPYNDPAYEGNASYEYVYQKDGTTLGAEGPNVKIGFAQETTGVFVIDQGANSGQVFGAGLQANESFTSYASPYKSGERSWQRDEVYRLYLVFFNAHGIASTAKWVCDLRMPSCHNTTYGKIANAFFGETYALPLYPTIEIGSFPTGAVSAQLLRVERGGEDRSILTQAVCLPIGTISGAVRPQVYPTVLNNYGFVKLVSPEINILRNITKGSSDYLQHVFDFDAAFTGELTEVGNYIDYYKQQMPQSVTFVDNVKTDIDDTLYVEPLANTDTFSFHATTCANYDSATSSLGCSGLFVHHTNTTNWTAVGVRYVVVNYKRDVHASQYGGQTFESREGNIAIPASDIITTVDTVYTAKNGDTFINFFEVTSQISDLTKDLSNTLNENIYVPLESSINCELRHDRSASKAVLDVACHLIQEVAGKWTSNDGQVYDQTTSLYQYNTVYSQDSTAKFYVNVPSSVSTDTEFDCMVRVSKAKINGESQDSFTLFPINDFIEVATNKGEITALRVINDKLLFWQETAFGVLSVNERSLIQDSGGASLVLGTGGVLDRYDYISDTIGASASKHITPTQTGVYWVNTKDRSIYRFGQNLVNVSKSALIQSWLDEQLRATQLSYNIIRTTYDTAYSQVLFSFLNTDTDEGVTLVFDENVDKFTCFYDFYTYNFIPFREGYLSTSNVYSTDMLFFHNSKLKDRCCFYSAIPAVGASEATSPTPKYVNSTVKVLYNDDYNITKVYDNIAFPSTVTVNDIELYNNTFSSIRCYNNYQNTDYCNLVYGTNLERDEREWQTFVPRNAVDQLYTSSPDVFLAANIDKTRTFKERMRDKYMITDYTYTNTSNRRFVVPYTVIKYRISYR